jgi:thiamine-phosphate pyrophosphorylase
MLAKVRRVEARNVDGDTGKGDKQPSEKVRRCARDLFHANLKRAQEALRSLEEFSKLAGRSESSIFKRLRYACYRAEESAVRKRG